MNRHLTMCRNVLSIGVSDKMCYFDKFAILVNVTFQAAFFSHLIIEYYEIDENETIHTSIMH